jgi:hypothetical protein
MDDQITNLKASIFDIMMQIENYQNGINQLMQMKNSKLVELQNLMNAPKENEDSKEE